MTDEKQNMDKGSEFTEALKDQIRPFLVSTVEETVAHLQKQGYRTPKMRKRLNSFIWEIYADIAIEKYEEFTEPLYKTAE